MLTVIKLLTSNSSFSGIRKGFGFNRLYSVKQTVKLDENVSKNIAEEVYKPRRHPGRIKIKTVVVPEIVVKAIQIVTEDYSIKNLLKDGEVLAKHLKSRLPPIEKNELKELKTAVVSKVLEKETRAEPLTDLDKKRFQQSVDDKTRNKLKSMVYNWSSIDYNTYNSFLYLLSRFAPDYAVLAKIFYEITLRDENFKPRSFLDFGSGTGTATWAANLYWKNNFFEYLNVDSSEDMNDLALMLLLGGRINNNVNMKGTFYRQFLPVNNVMYDLVVCAYTLLELPSLKSRLQTVLNLWNKTSRYLVLVEYGTNAGFKVINEARDFILNIGKEENIGHVFSPCPHDMICPRFLTDNTPCNFEVSYMPLPFGESSTINKEKYSYVVLKKGKRNDDDLQWPRIVRQPIVKSKHSVCRMCTKHGKLSEVVFSLYKHGKSTYYCARMSDCGDLLPVELNEDT